MHLLEQAESCIRASHYYDVRRVVRRQINLVRAFTLIELLVVISIISLLVSILLPSLSRARDLARDVTCLSNLKQIGIGVTIYANDYEHYPYVYNSLTQLYWYGTLELGNPENSANVFICPSSQLRWGDFAGRWKGNYAWNIEAGGTYPEVNSYSHLYYHDISDIERPDLAGAIADANYGNFLPPTNVDRATPWFSPVLPLTEYVDFRHSMEEMTNLLYLDGHTCQVTLERLPDELFRISSY